MSDSYQGSQNRRESEKKSYQIDLDSPPSNQINKNSRFRFTVIKEDQDESDEDIHKEIQFQY